MALPPGGGDLRGVAWAPYPAEPCPGAARIAVASLPDWRLSDMTPSSHSRRRFLSHTAASGALAAMLPAARCAVGRESLRDRPVFATLGLRNQGWSITE